MESTEQSSDAATGQCKMPLQSTGVSSAAVSGESSKTSTNESVMAPESIESNVIATGESSISMLEGSSMAFPEESRIMSTGEPNVVIVEESNLVDMVVEEGNISECKPKTQLLYFPVLLCKNPIKL